MPDLPSAIVAHGGSHNIGGWISIGASARDGELSLCASSKRRLLRDLISHESLA